MGRDITGAQQRLVGRRRRRDDGISVYAFFNQRGPGSTGAELLADFDRYDGCLAIEGVVAQPLEPLAHVLGVLPYLLHMFGFGFDDLQARPKQRRDWALAAPLRRSKSAHDVVHSG